MASSTRNRSIAWLPSVALRHVRPLALEGVAHALGERRLVLDEEDLGQGDPSRRLGGWRR